MVQSTIEFKITFDTSTTSYYSMLERMVQTLKDELRKAYYDTIGETSSSDTDSDDESPDYKTVEDVLSRLDVSSVSSTEIEIVE